MNNLELWNKYKEVPKNALKPFDNGSFKGTDINTMWRIKSLTEQFGICGIGWYYDIIKTWTENGVNKEILAFAEIKLYIKVGGEWSKGISAIGGNKLCSWVQSKSYNKNSDEAYKMAITDALGVACKYLGFGADVYWENDKTKYTENEIQNKGENATNKPRKEYVKNEPSVEEKPRTSQISNAQKVVAFIKDTTITSEEVIETIAQKYGEGTKINNLNAQQFLGIMKILSKRANKEFVDE